MGEIMTLQQAMDASFFTLDTNGPYSLQTDSPAILTDDYEDLAVFYADEYGGVFVENSSAPAEGGKTDISYSYNRRGQLITLDAMYLGRSKNHLAPYCAFEFDAESDNYPALTLGIVENGHGWNEQLAISLAHRWRDALVPQISVFESGYIGHESTGLFYTHDPHMRYLPQNQFFSYGDAVLSLSHGCEADAEVKIAHVLYDLEFISKNRQLTSGQIEREMYSLMMQKGELREWQNLRRRFELQDDEIAKLIRKYTNGGIDYRHIPRVVVQNMAFPLTIEQYPLTEIKKFVNTQQPTAAAFFEKTRRMGYRHSAAPATDDEVHEIMKALPRRSRAFRELRKHFGAI